MSMNESLKKPIHTITEWKAALFPDVTEHDMKNDSDKSPSDIAVTWATRAVKSLPNMPIKPTQ